MVLFSTDDDDDDDDDHHHHHDHYGIYTRLLLWYGTGTIPGVPAGTGTIIEMCERCVPAEAQFPLIQKMIFDRCFFIVRCSCFPFLISVHSFSRRSNGKKHVYFDLCFARD